MNAYTCTCVMNILASGSDPSSMLVELFAFSCVVGGGGEGEEGPLIISGVSRGGRAGGDCLGITGRSEDTCND